MTRGFGRVRHRTDPFELIAPLTAGTLVGLTHIPFAFSWLTVLPLAAVMYLIARERTPGRAFRTAFLAGLPWWTIHLFWLPQAFSSFLNPSVVWAVIPLLWPAEAFVGAAVAFLAHWVGRRPVPILGVLVCGWLLLEYWRAWYGSGISFPWGMMGYTMLDTPLAQTASLGGVWLVSLLVMGLSAGLAALAWGEPRLLLGMAALWILGFVYGLTRPVLPAASQTALLVQGNVDPIRRFTSGTAGDLEVYQNLSRQTGPNTLVVWPEAAVSVTDVRQSRVPRLVSGAYDFVGARDRLNLVLGFENGQERGRTSKTRFVPFGETFPLREPLDFVYAPIFQGMGLGTGFGRVNPEARLGQRLIVMGADRVGGYVCYDSGFPEVTRNLVRLGANILAESTNDGWFGGGTGNWQHFVIDRMRAIETDRFVLRAANTGVTALIDPRGRVVNNLPINRPGALPVRYARLETITPFVQFGDWAVILATALIPVMAWWGRQERRLL